MGYFWWWHVLLAENSRSLNFYIVLKAYLNLLRYSIVNLFIITVTRFETTQFWVLKFMVLVLKLWNNNNSKKGKETVNHDKIIL